jgi:serine/threonine protein kinase
LFIFFFFFFFFALFDRLSGYPPFGDDFTAIKQGQFNFEDERWDNISEEAKDLIRKLLTVNPHKRATVENVFAHPWMKVEKKK